MKAHRFWKGESRLPLNCFVSIWNCMIRTKWLIIAASVVSTAFCWYCPSPKCRFSSVVRSSTNELTNQHEPIKRHAIGTKQINAENVPAHCVSNAIVYPNMVCESNGNLFGIRVFSVNQQGISHRHFVHTSLGRPRKMFCPWNDSVQCNRPV